MNAPIKPKHPFDRFPRGEFCFLHLAKLGSWEPHKGRTPGKRTLQRGLARLLEMLATQAMLSSYATQHQGLPPRIAALFHGWHPPGDL